METLRSVTFAAIVVGVAAFSSGSLASSPVAETAHITQVSTVTVSGSAGVVLP